MPHIAYSAEHAQLSFEDTLSAVRKVVEQAAMTADEAVQTVSLQHAHIHLFVKIHAHIYLLLKHMPTFVSLLKYMPAFVSLLKYMPTFVSLLQYMPTFVSCYNTRPHLSLC